MTVVPFRRLASHLRSRAVIRGLGLSFGLLAAGAGAADNLAGWPHATAKARPDAALEARIASMVSAMTLEQKVGQMTQPEIAFVTPDEVRRFHIGSVLNGGGSWPAGQRHARAADWLALAQTYYDASMASDAAVRIPVIWGTDAVHGHNNAYGATLFPHHIGLGAANDPALVREIGAATAKAVRATGIQWVFAPTIAVARDDRWGRTYESFSEEPALVASLGEAYVKGLQGGLGGDTGVVATAKHFMGDGGTDQGRDQGVNLSSAQDMLRWHASAYYRVLAAGAQTVMASFNSWNDRAAGIDHGKMHGSATMLTGLLKQRMGFDGFVVTDWNGIGQVPGCSNASCPQAINAGIDMVMVPEEWKAFIANTVAQVKTGQIPISRIDDAVSRILRVKLRAGLFERAPSHFAVAGHDDALRARALARRAVRQSMVLLKNDGQVLPLPRTARVLVVGKSADSLENQTGGWSLSWQGTGNTNTDFPAGQTVLAGLREALGAARVEYSASGEGLDPKDFDAVVAVLGERPYAEGNGDIPPSGTLRHSSRHPEDLAVLRRVAGQGRPVITVFMSGRPLYVNDMLNLSDAFVAAWLPGTEGGGVADLLLRAVDGTPPVDFRGRLSFSWPAAECQTPLNAGDARYTPLFRVGYGLTLGARRPLGRLPVKPTLGGCGARREMAIFSQAAQAPYSIHVGSPAGHWPNAGVGGPDLNATLTFPAQAPEIRVSTVQMHTQQDAKRVDWLGGSARFFAWAPQSVALAAAYPDGALVFDTLVYEPPAGPVWLAMGCGTGCAGRLDVAALFGAGPVPRSIKVPLACFTQRGADLSRVDEPFSITADGTFSAAFARIRVVAGAAKDTSAVRCSDLPNSIVP